MQRFIAIAAFAATALFGSPALAHEGEPAPVSLAAPGQSKADYHAWLARSADNRAAVMAFRDRLTSEGLGSVVPIWQLVRTSSSWESCSASAFEVAPADKWSNIADTLRFVKTQVIPALGPVEALSAYRNEALNACSDGAPRSAHRLFFALDLAPASSDVSREKMIGAVCRAHAQTGQAFRAGLGFYSGLRFHIDSNGFRRWGTDGSGASSPCGPIT